MKSLRFLLLAAALIVALPAIAEEAPEAPLDADITAEAPLVEVNDDATASLVMTPMEGTDSDAALDWMLSGEDSEAPLNFFGTTCSSWSYAGCCNQSQTKFTRDCWDTNAPWYSWSESRCQNGCLL